MEAGHTYMIARTDFTLLGVTYSRGQYFDAALFKQLPEKRQQQLIALAYVREPHSDDEVVGCDKCGAEFCLSTLYHRHAESTHVRARIDLDGPHLKDGEDPRRPADRPSPVLSDAEFAQRATV